MANPFDDLIRTTIPERARPASAVNASFGAFVWRTAG